MMDRAAMRSGGLGGAAVAIVMQTVCAAAADDGRTAAGAQWDARRFVVRHDAPLMRAPAPDAPVVAQLAGGAVVTNLGCAAEGGRVWCAVRPPGGARAFVAGEALVPARGPDGTVPTGPDDSGRRAAKGEFDRTGRVPCAQVRGEALGTCRVGVSRGTGGDASVVVTFANGFSRTLYFENGAFVRGNATMSGVGTDTDWRVEGDTHVIRVDDQRYRLPDALVFGR